MITGGSLLQKDFFDSTGGMNVADSPMRVDDTQTTGGVSYDLVFAGGIRKRLGHQKINSVADTQLRTFGAFQYHSASGTKFLERVAGTKIQNFDPDTLTFTNLSEDTLAASTDFPSASSTIPAVFSQFNNGVSSILWAAGAGMSSLYGAYSTSKVTKNGTPAPTGSIGATVSLLGGSWAATGTYYYAVLYKKTSTSAFSNAALDVVAVIANTTDKVTLDFTTITNNDTTKYSEIWLYRSAVSGVSGFTTGTLVAQLPASTTNYIDLGNVSVASAQVLPRAGSTILDNSVLPTGTYNSVTTFKRRLVTAYGSTIRLSEVNKSESWPTINEIVVPSGGPITALGVISFTSVQAQTLDEILFIMKERELWVITGNSVEDWVLKFIDNTGTATQASVVSANGYIAFIDPAGIYLWDGGGKPVYISRTIAPLFAKDGEIDKAKLGFACGSMFRRTNQIVWFLSHKTYGENQYALKLDLRLTLPRFEQNLEGRVSDAVFCQDSSTKAIYACHSYLPPNPSDEVLLLGDASGFMYRGFNDFSDSSTGIAFTYASKFHDLGSVGQDKRFHKVIVWVKDFGDWFLNLDYWTGYRNFDSQKTTLAEKLQTSTNPNLGVWDIGYWDISFWDDYIPNIRPLVFNLSGAEGDCIRIQFRNTTSDQPIEIAGYSIVYSMKGLSK